MELAVSRFWAAVERRGSVKHQSTFYEMGFVQPNRAVDMLGGKDTCVICLCIERRSSLSVHLSELSFFFFSRLVAIGLFCMCTVFFSKPSLVEGQHLPFLCTVFKTKHAQSLRGADAWAQM